MAALVEYDDAGSRLVGALKYRNARRVLPWLAVALADIARNGVDVVTWAPTTATRRRHRGFDQAERLAVHLARRLRLPSRPLLRRIDAHTQTGRSRAERFSGLVFEAESVHDHSVLIVDDVITTGATLRAAATALNDAGAAEIHAVAVAYTPPDRAARLLGQRGRRRPVNLPVAHPHTPQEARCTSRSAVGTPK